jgi:hypothetical protein
MKLVRFTTPVLALALAACPAVRLHAQEGPGHGQWDAPPAEYHDAGRQGFHDGMESARHAWENREPMDPHRSPRFRHPPVPPEVRHEYREGFERGYNAAMHHHHDFDHDGR